MNLNIDAAIKEINLKLREISGHEVIESQEDVPLALNILKLLEIVEKGNFYGVLSIKILGVTSRNIRVTDQSFKLLDEKSKFFLDSG